MKQSATVQVFRVAYSSGEGFLWSEASSPWLGYKMSVTTRTHNLTVNHRRKILHSTNGHPGCWNDKTLVRFDGFMQQLRDGKFNSTMSFVLSNEHGRDVTI